MKELPLSRGLVALVDDDVYEWAVQFNWSALATKSRTYAFRNIKTSEGKKTTAYLHREIMRAQKGQDVDHINGDVLDNRKENLRCCTRSQNLANQNPIRNCLSKRRGVAKTISGKWMARFWNGNKAEYLGSFDTINEAFEVYQARAKLAYGEFFRSIPQGNSYA